MAESPDVNALKRRSRRRLVGAIALVLLAVIVLPMVFDPEPRLAAPSVSVRIPGEDDSVYTPKVTPRGEPAVKAPARTVPGPEPAKDVPPPPGGAEKPAEKAIARPAPPPEPKKSAGNVPAEARFVIALGAYADEKNVRALLAKLKAEKIPAFTEPLDTGKGVRTRVRAGPFSSEAAAEKARARLLRLGVQPGPVAPGTG